MDTDLVTYLDTKFQAIHNEIHPLQSRVTAIETYIKTKKENEKNKLSKAGISLAGVASIIAIIAILI